MLEVIVGVNFNVIYGLVDYLDKGFIGYIICCGFVDVDVFINWVLGLMNEGS